MPICKGKGAKLEVELAKLKHQIAIIFREYEVINNANYRDYELCLERATGDIWNTIHLHQYQSEFNKGDYESLIIFNTVDENIEFFANGLLKKNINIDGILHAVAMDKTIRNKKVKPLLEVTLNEFCETLDVSAFSLIRLTNSLFKSGVLNPGASICALSYIAAEKVTFHPYRNMSIAKAALERIVIELADEMGRHNGTRVNAIRFSTYLGSKAGAATLTEKDVSTSDRISPLGNATPSDLANEVVHLLRPGSRITGEIRHVDGGYHIMG